MYRLLSLTFPKQVSQVNKEGLQVEQVSLSLRQTIVLLHIQVTLSVCY